MKTIAAIFTALSLLALGFLGTARAEERDLSAVASRWNHNGSIMGLIPEGNRRTIIYIRPRPGIANLVRPGTVLFTGTSNGSSYNGTARRFMAGEPPLVYSVSGPIKKNGDQVVLSGTAALRNADGSIRKVFEDVLVFDLISAK